MSGHTQKPGAKAPRAGRGIGQILTVAYPVENVASFNPEIADLLSLLDRDQPDDSPPRRR